MRIRKWVEFATEAEIDIDARDVTGVLYEAFQRVRDRDNPEIVHRSDVLHALNQIGVFLRAISPEMLELMTEPQRSTVAKFLHEQATRFEPSTVKVKEAS